MDDANLSKIIGGSVDDAKPALSGLSRDDLQQLHDAESKGQNRTTLLSAIDAAMKALPASGRDPSGADDKVYTQAQVDKILKEQRAGQAGMFTQAQLDEALATQKLTLEAERSRAVADATGATAALVAKDVPGALTIATSSRPSDVLMGGGSIQFVDDKDRPVEGLPPIKFAASDFEPSGSAMTLKAEVEFPKAIAANEISGAFLLDDEDEPIGKATLVMPFAIGGGRTAKLAKSTLQFAR